MPNDKARPRLINAMTAGLRKAGLHGVGLNEVLETAKAPKGVLYHHFPGGKTELAIAAIHETTARLIATLDRMLAEGKEPLLVLDQWLTWSLRQLEESHFQCGCPLATVALETTADDQNLRQALAGSFAAIRSRIAVAMETSGRSPQDAEATASLIIATYEGGLLQARVANDIRPMAEAVRLLISLFRSSTNGLPAP